MQQKTIIAGSILSADFAHLAQDTQNALNAGVHAVHFDVMDHHYVPNLSFGAVVCGALRKADITAPIDVHLMVTDPESYIEPFAKAGANRLTFHPETVKDVNTTCQKIINAGMSAGLAFNPDQTVDISKDTFPLIDMILLMSVFPGFGGQSFISDSIQKVESTRALIDQRNLPIYLGIDGGIKADNIRQVVDAGADFIVMGSGIFNAANYEERLSEIKNNLS